MIDINFIPVEKGKRKKKGGFLPEGFVLPREVIIGLIGGFVVLLAVGHIFLQAAIFTQYARLKGEQAYWQRILPEKKEVDQVLQDLRTLQLRLKSINEIKGDSDCSIAGKLNVMSNVLPRGVWLREIMLQSGEMSFQGSSVSKHKVEKINIYNYVKDLKEAPVFMEKVLAMEVESVKARQAEDTSIADFEIKLNFAEEKEAVKPKDEGKGKRVKK